jgi:RHS repeat-associated protein
VTNINVNKIKLLRSLAAVSTIILPLIARAQEAPEFPTTFASFGYTPKTEAVVLSAAYGNAVRVVNDLSVASVSEIGLNWTRYHNTQNSPFTDGAFASVFANGSHWSHSFDWRFLMVLDELCNPEIFVGYPDGSAVRFFTPTCGGQKYYSDSTGDQLLIDYIPYLVAVLTTSDNHRIHFTIGADASGVGQGLRASSIEDSKGNVTTLSYNVDGELQRVTDPSGHYLQVNYEGVNLTRLCRSVTTSDGRSVTYSYSPTSAWGKYLTGATYSDQKSASYTIIGGSAPGVLDTATDVRAEGPRSVRYEFKDGFYVKTIRDNTDQSIVLQANSDFTERHNFWWTIAELRYPDGRYYGFQRTSSGFGGNINTYTDASSGAGTTTYVWDLGHSSAGFSNWDGRLIKLTKTDAKTRVWKFTYNARGQLLSRTAPATAATGESTATFGYTNGYLTSSKDENLHETVFTRDPARKWITRIDYPDNTYESFPVYNGFGQVKEHRQRDGRSEYFTYYPDGLLETRTDATGAIFRYTYDEHYRVKTQSDGRGNDTSFLYNDRGQVTRVTNPDQSYKQYFYDDWGNLESATDELFHTTTHFYDSLNRRLWTKDPYLKKTSYNYDPLTPGNRQPSSVETPLGSKTESGYDSWHGFQIASRTLGVGTADAATSGWEYDLLGNLKYETDPKTNRTEYEYDERNRRIWMKNSIATDRNANGHTMDWDYDDVNNKKKETRADNYYRRWEYDSMNRVQDTYGFMNEHTHYEFDDGGNIESITDAKGATYSFLYDGRNRKTDATYPSDATATIRTEQWRYDSAGNLYLYKNPKGQYKHATYDCRNRRRHSWWSLTISEFQPLPPDVWPPVLVTSFIQPLPPIILPPTPVDDAGGDLPIDPCDPSPTAIGDPAIGPDLYTTYDKASRVTEINSNSGQAITAFGYDDVNRKIWEDQSIYMGGFYPQTYRVETDYNDDGDRTSLRIPAPDWYFVRFDYTGRKELKNVYDRNYSPLFRFSYDPAGNLTKRQNLINNLGASMNAPSQFYDGLNRPTMWEQTGVGDVPFARSWYQYDKVGREVATWRDEEASKGELFLYSPSNHLTQALYHAIDVMNGHAFSASRNVIYTLTPDNLNRQSVTDVENGYVQTSSYGWNAMNQYTVVSGNQAQYDGNFNLTYLDCLAGSYDAANHLVTAAYPGAPGGGQSTVVSSESPNSPDAIPEVNASFVYDGLGRCVRRTFNGTTTNILYDGWNPIVEFTGFDTFGGSNIYGARPDEILYRKDSSGAVRYYHLDPHGNVMFLTNSSGGVIERYFYDVFGNPTITDAAGNAHGLSSWYGNRFMFTGREWLGELRLYDYRNRFYNPSLGRFLQPDPLGLQIEGAKLGNNLKALFSPGGIAPDAFSRSETNLFRYCGDDPVDNSDPLGLLSIIIPGFGPGQRDPTGHGHWSNQRFIQGATRLFGGGEVFSRNEMGAAKARIFDARSRGDTTLNIAGYSLGAAAAIGLARDVGQSGIGVDKLLTIDIVRAPWPFFSSGLLPNPVNVPSNVKEAYNYYQQSGGLLLHPTNFTGTPVMNAPNVMVNRSVTPADVGGPVHHAWMPGFVFPDR